MSGSVVYLDSSAFLKLLVAEPESKALRTALVHWPRRASATLIRTEVVRALRRAGAETRLAAARRMLRRLQLIQLDEALLDRAGELDPRDLRSLDAVHVAAALALGSDLGGFMTYDERLAAAARDQGLTVLSPS